MSPDTIQAKVGGVTLALPIYHDEKTTLDIVDAVNNRLAEIEKGSIRIDTQAFALQAAIHFAAELERCRREEDGQNRALTLALDTILERLRAVVAAATSKK
jgi:cell division protein ZapA (FtsZ GTPase activity inhibitor)